MKRLKQLAKRILPPALLLRLQAMDHWKHGEPELKLISQLCHPDRLSIDAGANIGVYSYYMAKYSKSVRAYEPHPHLAKRLIKALPVSKVSIIQAALSEKSGSAHLKMAIESGQELHELGSICQSFDEAEQVATYPVEIRRLDDENLENVGFIKIDVEQHERAVLAGAQQIIERDRPNFMTEVSPLLYESALPDVFSTYLEMGYQGWFLFEGSVRNIETYEEHRHAAPDNLGVPGRFVKVLIFTMPPLEPQLP
ncbi:MAG: FkbM family methyltransferase [Magnetococcales bacterium]|nr:FkbM family methyltransferase [Magnetococcales bacterium]